jgi:hypothetical protein
VRRRQGGDRAEAGAEQAPGGRLLDQRHVRGQQRQQFVGEELGVPGRVRVLGQPVLGMQERDHRLGHLLAVDQVVQHGLRRGAAQEVAAVVDDQQRVAAVRVEAGRDIQVDRVVAAQHVAAHHQILNLTGRRLRVRDGPVRGDVRRPEAHRRVAHRAVRQLGVERIVHALGAAVVAHLELVLDPRVLGHLEDHVPQIGVRQPPHRQPVGQAHDPLGEPHGVRLAAVQERAEPPFHHRRVIAGQEPVDRGAVDSGLAAQPVDRECGVALRDGPDGHAAYT